MSGVIRIKPAYTVSGPTSFAVIPAGLLFEEVETLSRQLRCIEQKLSPQARRTSAAALLRSIPGVGARTAEAVAEFAGDPNRFRNAKAVGRYFGLVPCQDRSGERNRLGHITREGAPAARAYFERFQRGDPHSQDCSSLDRELSERWVASSYP
jgi:transposase